MDLAPADLVEQALLRVPDKFYDALDVDDAQETAMEDPTIQAWQRELEQMYHGDDDGLSADPDGWQGP